MNIRTRPCAIQWSAIVTIGRLDPCTSFTLGMAKVKLIRANMPRSADTATPAITPRGTDFWESTASSLRSAESSKPTRV